MGIDRRFRVVTVAMAVAVGLAGCGLAETSATTGAAAASSARQSQGATQRLEDVKREVDAAQKAEETARAAAEKQATE